MKRNNFCLKAAWYPTVRWIGLQWTGRSKMLGDQLCSCNDHFQSNYDFLSCLFRKKSLLIRPREYIFVQISGEQIRPGPGPGPYLVLFWLWFSSFTYIIPIVIAINKTVSTKSLLKLLSGNISNQGAFWCMHDILDVMMDFVNTWVQFTWRKKQKRN